MQSPLTAIAAVRSGAPPPKRFEVEPKFKDTIENLQNRVNVKITEKEK